MKYRNPAGLVPAALLAIVLLSGCGVNQLPDPMFTVTGVDLRLAMRELWDADATWTQLYVADALAGATEAANAASNRLTWNMDDIANRFKTYYGEDRGNQLGELLRGRVSEMAAFVAAAPFRDSTQQKEALDQWTANADSIAELLSSVSPNWSKQTFTDLLEEQVNLVSGAVVSRLDRKYAADVKAGDAMHQQAMRVADELTTGIIKQFPTNFQRVKQQ
jgi:hypothetical protein